MVPPPVALDDPGGEGHKIVGMANGAEFIEVFLDAQEKQIAQAMAVPVHVYAPGGLVAAEGWCAPSPLNVMDCVCLKEVERPPEPIKIPSWWTEPRGPRLACGCSLNVLESGWHEPGCEVVGEYLCRPATKPSTAAMPSALVVYEA